MPAVASPPATAHRPVLLALDTATERLHLALSLGEGGSARVEALELAGGPQASAAVLPGLLRLLTDAGLGWRDVDAIAFGSGPGAFTGLRTACSVTQGLAMGLNVPVIALDTLMAVAEDARQRAGTGRPAVPQDALQDGEVVWVLQDARMGELYAASFRWAGDGWCPAEPPALWSLEEPRRRWQATTPEAPIKVCGNAWEACAPAFTGLAAEQVRRWGEAAAPSGAALASLAWQAWQAGAWVDPALALPRYVRDKVALTTAERQVPSGMMTA